MNNQRLLTHGVLSIAEENKTLKHLSPSELLTLFNIVVHENEDWDGEEVSASYVTSLMESRFKSVGLIPSRN